VCTDCRVLPLKSSFSLPSAAAAASH
jgi:hypothetical protein